MQITYNTGRSYDYGHPQLLAIRATPAAGADDFALVPADFVDAQRNIAGRVSVFMCECKPRDLGPAVLREYDAGRYTLA